MTDATSTPPPEPPDGSRIEFTHDTDVYGAWRNDSSSVAAGWPADHGWCLYGDDVPRTWAEMWETYGESLLSLRVLQSTAALDAACFSVYLHGDDRWLTSQMTTEEREAFADACDRHRGTWPLADQGAPFERWWRDSEPVGGPG